MKRWQTLFVCVLALLIIAALWIIPGVIPYPF